MDEEGQLIGDATPDVPPPSIPTSSSEPAARRRSDNARSPRALGAVSRRKSSSGGGADDWQPPHFTGGFRSRIGSSVIEEFVAGHDAGDVLRELVQNEFDAGGTQVSITFGKTGLTVSGNGRPINTKGWSRLDVAFGTGRVIGSTHEENVEAKENGIGSKNFGLRSLFRFGNRIHVRSNGRMAVLDLPEMGTQLVADPASRGRRGIGIHVPYRTEPFQSLDPFTIEGEQRALEKIESGLLPTLVKLALPGRHRGIQRLTLVSERTGQAFDWRQKAEAVKCRMTGVSAVHRAGRLGSTSRANGERPRSKLFEEVEFSRSVAVPAEHANIRYPSYYRAPHAAVRVCVSIPLRHGNVDRTRPGRFYYPLQTPPGSTGVPVSVSAPFKLNEDRTRLLGSDWNRWLAEQAAALAQDLLAEEWLPRFGAEAYLVLAPKEGWSGSPDDFATRLFTHFREAACWPTRADTFAKASQIVVPAVATLDGFLSRERYLDPRLAASEAAVSLVLGSGAARFTLNSLVRLRCAGTDGNKLATKPAKGEANYNFTDYTAALIDPDQQQKMAGAVTALLRRLSNHNRKGLKETASTLAADGTLRRADSLVHVDKSLWEICPEPFFSRLHPVLVERKGIAGLCRPFSADAWIIAAAGRAAAGKIAEPERMALYGHLLAEGAKLGRKALAAVRRSPVVLDHRGNWGAPVDMALLPASQAALVGSVVSAPAPELAACTEFLRRLRVRRKLTRDDLVRFARKNASSSLQMRSSALLTARVATPAARLAPGHRQAPPTLNATGPSESVARSWSIGGRLPVCAAWDIRIPKMSSFGHQRPIPVRITTSDRWLMTVSLCGSRSNRPRAPTGALNGRAQSSRRHCARGITTSFGGSTRRTAKPPP